MFRIRKISNLFSSLNEILTKANKTINSSIAAAKTTGRVKSSPIGIMIAKEVKDSVFVSYSNYMGITFSKVGRCTNVINLIFGNSPELKRFTSSSTSRSVGCKSFVQMCRTDNIIFL